jgi:hypothetical protein
MQSNGLIAMGSLVDSATTASLYGWSADTAGTHHTIFNGANNPTVNIIKAPSGAGSYGNIIDGIEVTGASDAILNAYFTTSGVSFQRGNIYRNILGTHNTGDIHLQGPGHFEQNILTRFHHGDRWSMDYSTYASAYVENVVIDGYGDNTSFTGDASNLDAPITLDNGPVVVFKDVTIKNISLATGCSVIAANSTTGTLAFSPGSSFVNLIVDTISATNPTVPVLVNSKDPSLIFNSSVFKNVSVTGTIGSSLVNLTNDKPLNSEIAFYNCEFKNLGYTANNAFSTSTTGGTATINLVNTTTDGTAINNATSSINSPIGYYKYNTSKPVGWSW